MDRFFVEVPLYWAGDDWTTEEFKAGLFGRIAEVAQAGASNTNYMGSTSR